MKNFLTSLSLIFTLNASAQEYRDCSAKLQSKQIDLKLLKNIVFKKSQGKQITEDQWFVHYNTSGKSSGFDNILFAVEHQKTVNDWKLKQQDYKISASVVPYDPTTYSTRIFLNNDVVSHYDGLVLKVHTNSDNYFYVVCQRTENIDSEDLTYGLLNNCLKATGFKEIECSEF